MIMPTTPAEGKVGFVQDLTESTVSFSDDTPLLPMDSLSISGEDLLSLEFS